MASIIRYNPFEQFLAFPAGTELEMKIDVKEDDKSFTVKADIPGVKKEDIQIDIEDDRVSVRAEVKQEKEEKKGEKVVYSERSYGAVSRSFTLPKKSNGSAKRISVS